jgi:hypothetical protein
MSKSVEIFTIEKPQFTVRVYENMLKIDLKGGVKDEVEEALENKPVLKETIGRILEMFIPLHVRLSDINSVCTDKKGNVVMELPRHRDIIIPLDQKDAEKLVDKLNQLVPEEKEKEIARIMKEQKLQRIEKTEREFDKEAVMPPIGGSQHPIPPPPGVREKEKEAAEEQEK